MTDRPPQVSFYRTRQAFPDLWNKQRPDDILVMVKGRDLQFLYEFTIEHVGSDTRRPIALRVQLFEDSWRAFADLPDFFALLARLDKSEPNAAGRMTLDDLQPLLLELGWEDTAPTYAARHEHVIGCVSCGARGVASPSVPTTSEEERG